MSWSEAAGAPALAVERVKVALVTVGCRSNRADAEVLARALDPACFDVVDPAQRADVYVVSSCTVTAAAERDVRRALRAAQRTGGQAAKIVLTGCLAAPLRTGAEVPPGVWRVVPSAARGVIPGLLATLHPAGRGAVWAAAHPVPEALRRRRPSLRVQDGCDVGCAYCAVAAARGESRSLTLEAVVGWVRRLAAEGAREVVVCGTNLGAWGADLRPRRSFAELVGALEQCEVLERYRLGSIEPWAFDDAAAVEAIARARKVAPHLHLPLQSGDPATLRRMGRHQSPEGFATVVERLRAAVPGLAVGVDVIAGLPGESDEAFARTIALLDAVTPAYLHGFGFSPRPGTAAAAMRDRPDGATVGRRVAALAARGRDLRRRFAASLVGDVVRALVVRRSPRDGRLVGLAGRYVFVRIDGGDDLVNCIVEVAVERAGPAGDVEGRALRVDRPATAPQTQRDHNERCNP